MKIPERSKSRWLSLALLLSLALALGITGKSLGGLVDPTLTASYLYWESVSEHGLPAEDPWGHRFVVSGSPSDLSPKYSVGPNGIDNGRSGDDVPVLSQDDLRLALGLSAFRVGLVVGIAIAVFGVVLLAAPKVPREWVFRSVVAACFGAVVGLAVSRGVYLELTYVGQRVWPDDSFWGSWAPVWARLGGAAALLWLGYGSWLREIPPPKESGQAKEPANGK